MKTNPQQFADAARIACLNLATPPPQHEEPFAAKLKHAVKGRLATRKGRSRSQPQAGQEDFGKKLTVAVKTRLATR